VALKITDLIYDRGAWRGIKDAFPAAKLTDASDYIHEGRFSVDLEAELEDWYYWLIKTGWADCSLWFQLDLRGLKKERVEIVKRALARVKAEENKEG